MILRTKLTKLIVEKKGINYKEAIGVVNDQIKEANGKSWKDIKESGSMTYEEVLQKTIDYLNKK